MEAPDFNVVDGENQTRKSEIRIITQNVEANQNGEK